MKTQSIHKLLKKSLRTLFITSLLLTPQLGTAQEGEDAVEPAEPTVQAEPLDAEAFENVLLPTAWEFTQSALEGDWASAAPYYLVPPEKDGVAHPLAVQVQQIYEERQLAQGESTEGFEIFTAQPVRVLGFQGGWLVPILYNTSSGKALTHDLWVNTRNGWRVLPIRAVDRENILITPPAEIMTQEIIPQEQVDQMGETLEKLQEEGKELGRQLLDELEKLGQ